MKILYPILVWAALLGATGVNAFWGGFSPKHGEPAPLAWNEASLEPRVIP